MTSLWLERSDALDKRQKCNASECDVQAGSELIKMLWNGSFMALHKVSLSTMEWTALTASLLDINEPNASSHLNDILSPGQKKIVRLTALDNCCLHKYNCIYFCHLSLTFLFAFWINIEIYIGFSIAAAPAAGDCCVWVCVSVCECTSFGWFVFVWHQITSCYACHSQRAKEMDKRMDE